jgi:hypothetical protein
MKTKGEWRREDGMFGCGEAEGEEVREPEILC